MPDPRAVVASAVTARGLFDYRLMFGLTPAEITGSTFLDCAAGASSFAAQVRARGGTVTSVDLLYDRPVEDIVDRVHRNLEGGRTWLAEHSAAIDWDYLGSPDAHVRASETAADLFALDYQAHPEHYLHGALPRLPIPDRSVDVALCSNLLFAYPQLFDRDAHIAALLELCRCAHHQVRVHPVCDITTAPYPHLEHVRNALAAQGIATDLQPIPKSWIAGARTTLVCTPNGTPRRDRGD